jgi:hypothetical protein
MAARPTLTSSGWRSAVSDPWLAFPEEFLAPTATSTAFSTALPASPKSVWLGQAVGHVHERRAFWNNLGDAYASNLLNKGYKIPQVGAPDVSYREANNRSALNEMPWVRGKVARLLEAGCIVQVPQQPRCTNPLTVAYNQKLDGTIKKPLCIDLSRHVNVYVPPDAYKMVTLKEVFEMTMPGTYMSTFDVEKKPTTM